MIEPVYRRWGSWEVIRQGNYGDVQYKVKFLTIVPGKSISLQFHDNRDEYWTVIQGEAVAIAGEDVDLEELCAVPIVMNLKAGHTVTVPRNTIHKITNTGDIDLVILELQMGTECDEEDITRLEKIDGEG